MVVALSGFGVQLCLGVDAIVWVVGTIGSKDIVPEHGVLPVVALGNPMVDIVGLGIVNGHSQYLEGEIESGVVQARENPTQRQKEESAHNVEFKVHHSAVQKDSEQVVVFTEGELDGMDIDGIDGGSAGCLLYVVVFVDERVQCLNVKKSVQECVEEIIDNVQRR